MKHWKTYAKIAALLIFPIVGAFGNRQRGTATEKRFLKLPKLVWYLIFTLMDIALIASTSYAIYVVWLGLNPWLVLCVGLLYLFGSYVAGFSPTWGELFPHVEKDTSGEEYAALVQPMTNKIMGYENDTRLYHYDKPKVLDWKTTGMSVRWVLYFTPQTLGYCAATLSPLPLLRYIPLWFVGKIYRHFHDIQREKGGSAKYDAVEPAEVWIGALLKGSDALLLIGAGYLNWLLIAGV